jgi:hypothetical protein
MIHSGSKGSHRKRLAQPCSGFKLMSSDRDLCALTKELSNLWWCHLLRRCPNAVPACWCWYYVLQVGEKESCCSKRQVVCLWCAKLRLHRHQPNNSVNSTWPEVAWTLDSDNCLISQWQFLCKSDMIMSGSPMGRFLCQEVLNVAIATHLLTSMRRILSRASSEHDVYTLIKGLSGCLRLFVSCLFSLERPPSALPASCCR